MEKSCYGNLKIFKDSNVSRKIASKNMKKLITNFLDNFSKLGYKKHPTVKISSGVDSSVHLIGSHISVFKPYLENDNVPFPGLIMSQDCIRTQNLKNYAKKDYTFKWGSSFSSLGLIAPPDKLQEVCNQSLDYIRDILQIKDENLKIMINSKDKDFMESCFKLNLKHIMEIDTMPLKYYRHKLGYENIFGRNFNFALKDLKTGEFADVGNIIIIEKDEKPVAVELALGTSTIIKQLCGLDHILDCTNIEIPNDMDKNLKRKIEDIIIVSVLLFREDLKPSNRGRGRILSDYVKSLSYLRNEANIPLDQLSNIIKKYEKDNFLKDKKRVSKHIREFIERFEKKTTIYNQFVERIKSNI